MYFVTVVKDNIEIVRRENFNDFSEALDSLSRFYKSRTQRSVLEFSTEVINGRFVRSYAELLIPSDVSIDNTKWEARRLLAIKQSVAFEYSSNFVFLIEGEIAIQELVDE